jgi:hypothetical protein
MDGESRDDITQLLWGGWSVGLDPPFSASGVWASDLAKPEAGIIGIQRA